MRTLSLCFFFLLNTNLATSQIPENADSIIKENNVIKETVVKFSYKNNVLEDTSNFQRQIFYNNLGQEIVTQVAFKNRSFITQDSMFYDEHNLLVKSVIYGNRNKPILTEIYEHDSIGNVTNSYSFGFKGNSHPNDTIRTSTRTKKIYNGKNLLLELYCNLNDQDSLIYKSVQYAYNSDGTIDKEFYFHKNGALYFTYFYTYPKDRYVKILIENKTGEPLKYSELFYNKKKQLTKRILYLSNDTNVITFNYNTDGTLFERNTTNNGKGITLERHFYTKK